MSSSLLTNKISHSILFSHEPLHPLPLKVFGFSCSVHNFCHSLDKLSAQLHKCVFLGLTKSQKGYKCFSSSLNCYFIFAYVTFIESCFYFESLTFPLAFNKVHTPIVFDTPIVYIVPKDSFHPPPFQVYSHRQTSHCPSDDSLFVSTLSLPSTLTVELDFPIDICKSICSTRNSSSHYTTLSYHRLSQLFYTRLSSISFVSILKTIGDALVHPSWYQTMLAEISAF